MQTTHFCTCRDASRHHISLCLSLLESPLFIPTEISSFFFQLFLLMNFSSSPFSCLISHSGICDTSEVQFGENMTRKVCSSNSLFMVPSAASCFAGVTEHPRTAKRERALMLKYCLKGNLIMSLVPGCTWSLWSTEAAQHPAGTAALLSLLTQSGVHHGRGTWGCFFRVFLPCFHHSVLGATLISESSWSSSSNCTELHHLREKNWMACSASVSIRVRLIKKYHLTCN